MIAFIVVALIVIGSLLTPEVPVNKSSMPIIRPMEGYSVDSTGKTYYEYNGKRVDSTTGTTLRETSGGYINTKDGTFVPKVGE